MGADTAAAAERMTLPLEVSIRSGRRRGRPRLLQAVVHVDVRVAREAIQQGAAEVAEVVRGVSWRHVPKLLFLRV
eukprot:13455628-Heterocapsa_arctica.AAC.1